MSKVLLVEKHIKLYTMYKVMLISCMNQALHNLKLEYDKHNWTINRTLFFFFMVTMDTLFLKSSTNDINRKDRSFFFLNFVYFYLIHLTTKHHEGYVAPHIFPHMYSFK